MLTSYELGIRKLNEFLVVNEAEKSFNDKQRIILVASEFDEQTLSAVAWLNSNDVDISCFKIIPYKIIEDIFFYIEKVLPVAKDNDFFVNLLDKKIDPVKKSDKKITRRSLPKIDKLLEWELVKAGDIIIAKGKEDEATLQANGNVNVNGVEKSMQVWLKEVYGWASIQTYVFAVHKSSGKTLHVLREEYMAEQEEKNNL